MSDVKKTFEQYNKSMPQSTAKSIDQSRNFSRPPITTGKNANTQMQGWRGQTDFGNVMNGTSGVDWNKNYTNWDVNSVANKANKTASIFNGIAMGLGAAVTGLSIFGGIKSIVGENKAAKTNAKQEAAANYNPENETTMMDVVNTADSYEKDGSLDQMLGTQQTLTKQISMATQQKKDAINNIETATKSKGIFEKGLKSAKNELEKFDTDKKELTGQLNTLKSTDRSQLTDEQKTQLDADIQNLEEQLKAFSDEKRSVIVKKVEQNQEGITEQTKIIADNKALSEKLDADIKTANSSAEKLNKKINNHKDNK